MAESFDDYRERVLGYLGTRDPVRVLQSTPSRLEAVAGGLRRPRSIRRPAPGKWSILEIVAHMGDAELAFGWRVRSVLATPGAALAWFDQDLWAERLSYANRRMRSELERFRALREGNLELIRGVPEPTWSQCYGVHELRGRQTLSDFILLEAGHDLNHLRQIRRILARR